MQIGNKESQKRMFPTIKQSNNSETKSKKTQKISVISQTAERKESQMKKKRTSLLQIKILNC